MKFILKKNILYVFLIIILNSCSINEPIVVEEKSLDIGKINKKLIYNSNLVQKKIKKDKNSLKKKFTVVIDPGHGGKDPGAIGSKGTFEKDINLKVSKILKRMLLSKNIKVILTRNNDKYLFLNHRVRFAEKANADLFISIHSDSSKNKKAKGASIFTLSSKSSDLEAKKLALRENKSDLIGGLKVRNKDPVVKNNLVKIFQRETLNESIQLATLMIRNFEKFSIVHRGHRFAGFVVLKSVTTPSILVELGFISNINEEKLLNSNIYLKKISTLICLSVVEYLKQIH